MAPIFITDDAALRQFIPNLLDTVEGEPTFFDRVQPGLIAAEAWLKENVIGPDMWENLGDEVANEELVYRVRNFTALMGFRISLGGLDLVITPNGCGIVSNSNIAPASKERVAALSASLHEREWMCLEQIFATLEKIDAWFESPIAVDLGRSMLYSPRLIRQMLKEKTPTFESFLNYRAIAREIESELIAGWFGRAFYERMARSLQSGTPVAPARGVQVLLINALLRNGEINKRHADDLVDYIRLHPDKCPEWHASEVAELFEPPIFQNRMNSGGYFF